mgnify:FL=1
MKKILSTVAAVSLVISSNASFAATNGSLSDPNGDSIGTKDITVFVKSRVKITGFDDFEVADWKIGDGDVNESDAVCIYANSAAGYNVTAASSGDGFNLRSSDNVHDLPYSLAWFDGTSAISLSHGVATTNNFTNYSRTSADCDGGTNSELRLSILATDLQAAPGVDSAYIDTVTITISPA